MRFGSRVLDRTSLSAFGATTAMALALPWLLGGSNYAFDVAAIALIYACFTVSWDLFCGATGELSFGHSFFVGAAGFATALIAKAAGASAGPALLCGAFTGLAGGALVGFVTLRHSGAVFTMVTMAMQLSFHRALFLWSDIFGGEEGLVVQTPWLEGFSARYVAALVVSIGMFATAWMVRASAFGRKLRASGGDTRIGLASGVPVRRVRVFGSSLSGLFAGVAGSLMVLNNGVANHVLADDALAGLIFLLAVIGGSGTLLGPWLAAVLYVAVLREVLSYVGSAEPVLVFGLLIFLVWLAPNGLIRTIAWRRSGGAAASPGGIG